MVADGISSYSGSGPIFDVGGGSAGGVRTLPELPCVEELGEGTSELTDGPPSDGTVVAGALTASSVMTGARDPPHVVQGAVAEARLV